MTAKSKQKPEDKLIVALDVETQEEALNAVVRLFPSVQIFKVGMQLFTSLGPRIVREIHKNGARVFLDLKFYDIPNTVAKVCEAAADLGVFMMNVHASGGVEMMKLAALAARSRAKAKGTPPPILLGVTVLTSFDQAGWNRSLGIERGIPEQVEYLARRTQEAGLDGVVASAQEIKLIRKVCGDKFAIATPGIRPADGQKQDQKRVTTPAEAIRAGSDYLVVGRPILAAPNPLVAAKNILDEIGDAL